MTTLFDRRAKGWCGKAAALAAPVPLEGVPYKDRRFCVLCMTPRSGSTFLGALMRANGLGNGQEHFRVSGNQMKRFVEKHDLRTYEAYFRRLVGSRTEDGVFSMKCDWWQFVPLYFFGIYDRYLRGSPFLYLTRGNLLDQAISRFVATETGYFHTTNTDRRGTLREDVPFNYGKIKEHLDHLVDMQTSWETFFSENGISPLRLQYEDIDKDPIGVLYRICDFLGKERPKNPVTETLYNRVRNERNAELAAAFIATTQEQRSAIAEQYQSSQSSVPDRKTGA